MRKTVKRLYHMFILDLIVNLATNLGINLCVYDKTLFNSSVGSRLENARRRAKPVTVIKLWYNTILFI